MKIMDNELKRFVDVSEKECFKRHCYWPRPDPGVFTPGRGYKSRVNIPSTDYLCGHRAIHGCPDEFCKGD